MNILIKEALEKKKIYSCDAEVIQKNIDAINFVSPKGREKAILSCIKHMAKAKRIIALTIREEKKRYKEFVLYFEALDEKGIAWGMSDLRRKAIELSLPIPTKEDLDALSRRHGK